MVGTQFIGKVRDLSVKGHGVVDHPNGLVFFVPGTWPGDEGEFQIVEVEKRYGFAKLLKLSHRSEHRVDVPCPHLGWEIGKCGGCPWMIGSYPSQLQYKEKFLRYQIQRANLKHSDFTIHPIWGSEKIFGYRNRAQLKTDGKQIGFVSTQSRDIAPIQDCVVLSDKNRSTLKDTLKSLPNSQWQPTEEYAWNFFDIDEEVELRDIKINKRRPFLQGNSQQNARMKGWLQEKLNFEDKKQSVLELFCGSGNFTETIVGAGFEHIVAAEVSRDAIETLQSKQLPGVTAVTLNMESQKSFQILKDHIPAPQLLILDPPRTGFEDLAHLTAVYPSLKTIYYVSCDILTYLRDVKKAESKGWKIQEIQPLDQFPHTTHTELLSILTK